MDKKLSLAMRDAYGEVLSELGTLDKDIVVLDADLSGSTKTSTFAKAFPDRFFDMGVAEQDLMGTAAGFAYAGKKVFASSFAMFAAGRPWEIIRNSICYPELNVKICASHAGITVGEDGATHQALEDVAIMRVLPNMRVFVPADYYEIKEIIRWLHKNDGPAYLRFTRSATPVIFDEKYAFNPNEYPVLTQGNDAAVFACGIMVNYALDAAEKLKAENINITVVNINSIKPIHSAQISRIAELTGAIVTAEEHNILGGMGSAIAEALAKTNPVPMEFVGTNDLFGESGKSEELLAKFNLLSKDIVAAVQKVIQRKKQ